MSRWTKIKYLEERRDQQKLWEAIRHNSPTPKDPESCAAKLFFYEECIKQHVPLDEAQLGEYKALKLQEQQGRKDCEPPVAAAD